MMKRSDVCFCILILGFLSRTTSAGCCRPFTSTESLREEQSGIKGGNCPLIEACAPPGNNAGDQMASCNQKGCYFALSEVCEFACKTTIDVSASRELGKEEEATGWSSLGFAMEQQQRTDMRSETRLLRTND